MRRFILAIFLLVIAIAQTQAQSNQNVPNGGATAPAVFPGTGCTYHWVNNNPAIGLPASGTGNIASFTATNNTGSPITATITATTVPSGIAYITNGGDATVSVYNSNTNTLIKTINVGTVAYGVAVSPDGSKVYVTNAAGGTFCEITTITNTITATVSAGGRPLGITVSPDGSRIYVIRNLLNQVTVYDATTYATIANIPVGDNPISMVPSADGSKIYVACSVSDNVSVINTATNTVSATISTGTNTTPYSLVLSPDGSKLYVTNAGMQRVSVINTATNAVTTTIPVGFSPLGITISPDGSKLYVVNHAQNSVSVINLATNSPITTIAVGDNPEGISITPDGTQVIVANTGSNNISIINAVTNTVTATVATGAGPRALGNFITPGSGCASAPITFTITVNPPLDQTLNNGETTKAVNFPGAGCLYNWVNNKPGIGLPATGTGNIAAFTAINTGSTPVVASITATPTNGGVAYVANTGSNTVSVVNTITNTVIATIPVGLNPGAIIVSPDGSRVYVINGMASTMSVINTATNTVIATLPTGSGAGGAMAISADGSRLYVPNTNANTVTVFNTATNTIVATIAVGTAPYGIVLSPDGSKAYVSNAAAGTVSIINTTSNTVITTVGAGTGMAGASSHVAISPDGSRLYVGYPATNSVAVLNLLTNSVVTNIPVNTVPYGLTVSPNGNRLYVATYADDLFVINTANNIPVNSVHIPGGQKNTSISADGAFLYIGNSTANNVAVFNTATNVVDRLIAVGSGPGNVAAFTGCTGSPVNFTITVNSSPTITAAPALGNITACFGSPSASPAIQQVAVSGSNLTADIVATAPANFEISLSAGSGYTNSLILAQASGSVASTIIYVRSAASAPIGGISGNVTLTSGAVSKTILVAGVINASPTINTVGDQIRTNGQATSAINFTGTGNTFIWTNDQPGIGLPASGSGNIASFVAVNTGNVPVVATISVTPQSASGCAGTPMVFKITVNANLNQTVNHGATTAPVNFPAGGCVYSWTNDNPTIGLPASGIGNIPAFTAVNNTSSPVVATIKANGTAPGGTAYIANTGDANVMAINILTNQVIATIPVGNNPRSVTVSPDGSKAYVTSLSSGTVTVINTATNTVIGTIPVSTAVYATALTPDGSRLYVTHFSSTLVSVVNTATLAVIGTITVGLQPVGIAVSPDGSRVYTANYYANTVSVISTATNTVLQTINMGTAPSSISFTPDGGKIYVTNAGSGTVSVISTATNSIVATISVGNFPFNTAISPDGTKAYVTCPSSNAVYVINTATNTVMGQFAVTTQPWGISITPDGSNLYITSVKGFTTPGTVSVVNAATYALLTSHTAGINPYNDGNNFIAKNAGSTCPPQIFTITVNAAPNITATTATGTIAACEGSPSASPNIQQFTVSGSNLTADISATALTNFEISLTATGGYANSVIIPQTGGSVGNTIVYVRAAATAPLGPIAGNITLTSGTASQSVAVNGRVNPLPTLNAASDQQVANGSNTTAVNFISFGALVSWTNDSPGIGLAANGSGNIASFRAINTGTTNIVATIRATPQTSGTGCTGTPQSFTITVTPTLPPVITSGTPVMVNTTYGTPSPSSSFPVSAANLTGNITITAPAGFEVSSDNITFGNTATIVVGAAGAVDSAPVYIRLKATTHVGVYSGNITFSSPGASAAAFMPNSRVNPAMLDVTANSVTKPYGTTLRGGPGSTAFTAAGLQNGETIGSGTIVYGTASAANTPVGNYTHMVVIAPISSLTGGTFLMSDYTLMTYDGSITVTPVPLTFTADNKTRNFGDPNPALTFTYSGFVNNETVAQLSTLPVVTTPADITSPPGNYPITVSGATSPNYTFVYVNGTLTVYHLDLPVVAPNTFTPNGDGVNDTWIIKNIQIHPDCTVNVFNRYGALVFTSIGYGLAWDGRHNGTPLPTGTYYYVINLKDNTKPLSGSITIIR